jgi:hypothetical protein
MSVLRRLYMDIHYGGSNEVSLRSREHYVGAVNNACRHSENLYTRQESIVNNNNNIINNNNNIELALWFLNLFGLCRPKI